MIVNTDLPTLCSGFAKNVSFATDLKIDNVHLKQLEAGVLNVFVNLKTLTLSGNEIAALNSGEFYNSSLLTKIDLSKNKLVIVKSNTFELLPKLEDLNLADNAITTLEPNWFVNCDGLFRIRLFNNFIKKIDNNMFKNLNSDLQLTVILGSNQIEAIENEAFHKMKHISDLTLTENSLTDFNDELLANAEDILLLELSRNKLLCVGEEVIRKTKMIFLLGNNFTEECREIIKQAGEKHHQVSVFV